MKYFAERSDFIFSTRVFQKIEINEKKEEAVLEEAVNLMKKFERKLNFYCKESFVSKINKYAGKEGVKVSSDTINIIKDAVKMSYLTDGLFDITVAPLVKAWSVNSGNPNILKDKEIKDLLEKVDFRNIEINEEESLVKLKNPGCMIDLGGIAKGYIADKIVELYESYGIKRGIINLGGNVKVLGKRTEEELWTVGIVEPVKHSNENIAAVSIENKSVVTSGSYERAFMMKGKLYSHILNPKTGLPCNTDLKSITIIDKSSIRADALSTPLFIMGKFKAAQFMKENKISGIMVTDDDKILISKDLIRNFKLFKQYEVFSF